MDTVYVYLLFITGEINVPKIESCYITTSSTAITAECTRFIGFQMVAQLSDSNKVNINQSMDLQTPVTVEVEESGVYQVTIFAIKEGTGILGSNVGYMEQVLVNSTITTTSHTTSLSVTLPAGTDYQIAK